MPYFLLLLPALAVGGMGCLLRRRSLRWGNALIVLGCLGCGGILAWQVRQSLYPAEAKAPNRAHGVVSFVLANSVLQEAVGKRGTVVLIFPPAAVLDAETAQNYANAFTPLLLRGHPEFEVQVARLELPAKAAKSEKPALAAYQQVVAKFPGALAFVSYAEVPPDIDQLFPPEQASIPPFHLFDSGATENWLAALKKGRIRSVIVPRPGVDLAARAGIAGPPGEIFDQLYLLATPETADQIAGQLARK